LLCGCFVVCLVVFVSPRNMSRNNGISSLIDI
jgi:hypothetical protein